MQSRIHSKSNRACGGCWGLRLLLSGFENREILWITKKLRRSGETNRFVVSPDGSTVYNLFYAYQGKTMCLHAERIIPAMHTHDIFPVKEPLNLTEGGLCITADLFCDSEEHCAHYSTRILLGMRTMIIRRPQSDYPLWNSGVAISGCCTAPLLETALASGAGGKVQSDSSV